MSVAKSLNWSSGQLNLTKRNIKFLQFFKYSNLRNSFERGSVLRTGEQLPNNNGSSHMETEAKQVTVSVSSSFNLRTELRFRGWLVRVQQMQPGSTFTSSLMLQDNG